MRKIETIHAEGHVLCHDLTRIVPGKEKGVAFAKGHVVQKEDIPKLLEMGKKHLYVWEKETGMLHENEAADILYHLCAGRHMTPSAVKEGKIDVLAACDGLLCVDTEALRRLNSLGEMMIATRHHNSPVRRGEKLAGTRVIPLVIEESKMEAAQTLLGTKPILNLHPFVPGKKVGIVTTGSEVASGLIEDKFTPVLRKKIAEYGAVELGQVTLDDNDNAVTQAILDFVRQGADLVLCSGGMSVDPDDKTPLAIKNTGARVVSYGAPVLPGAMFMLAYTESGVPIVGLPGCVMYAKRTIFDLILPRLVADVPVHAADLAALGNGGLCLSCETCIFPNCAFGAGV